MRARIPKICMSMFPSGSLATDSDSCEFTVHDGLLMRPCPANPLTISFSANPECEGTWWIVTWDP